MKIKITTITTILFLLSLGISGCKTSDLATVQTVDDSKSNYFKKNDKLTISPTEEGFNFRFENNNDSKLYYHCLESGCMDIPFNIQKGEVHCKIASSTSKRVNLTCEPQQPDHTGIYSFLIDKEVIFFSKYTRVSGGTPNLARIKYNSSTGMFEILK